MCIKECTLAGDQGFMVQCDVCKVWYHGRCVNLREFQARDVDKFHCPNCSINFGKSTCKPWLNHHRYEYWDSDARGKNMQAGTPAFIVWFKTRKFNGPSAAELTVLKNGVAFSLRNLESSLFAKPVLFEASDGLGLQMPPPSFSFNEIGNLVGLQTEIPVIDVYCCEQFKTTFEQFVGLTEAKAKVYNSISWEISDTLLSDMVKGPDIVAELSWKQENSAAPVSKKRRRPRQSIEKFCLMSMKDAYTDFHVDFSGSSVWYHVIKGEKMFVLIPPTDTNLSVYEEWQNSEEPSETSLLSKMPRNQAFAVSLRPGQTLLIPSGYIHAVLTVSDSLVFGGNFLHYISVSMMITIRELEKRTRIEKDFVISDFELACFAGIYPTLARLEDAELEDKFLPHLLESAASLITLLSAWLANKGRGDRLPSFCPPLRFRSMKNTEILDLLVEEVKRKRNLLWPSAVCAQTGHADQGNQAGSETENAADSRKQSKNSKRVKLSASKTITAS